MRNTNLYCKMFLTSYLFILFTIVLHAQDSPTWLRYPSISPDGSKIVFTYKGDLYVVGAQGGDARQLTFHTAHDYQAIWSPDGNSVAFASDRYGNFDIFIMPADGGQASRLTYHSVDETPFTFSVSGNEVVFGAVRMDVAEHRQYPTRSQPELYSVSTKGGQVDQVFTLPAEYVQYNKAGNKMIYHDKPGGENIWRKHHESSITRDIWTYDSNTQKHTMITSYKGEDRHPIWSDDESSMYFLSERSGNFNVYKQAISPGQEAIQLTTFDTHPVRFLSMGTGVLCFGYDGAIYTMKEGEQPKKLEIKVRTQDVVNKDKFISVSGGISDMAISPDGNEIAFISRGEVFVTSVDESFTKRITNTSEPERFVNWNHDGTEVIYSRESGGKWSTYKSTKMRTSEPFFYAATLIEEKPLFTSNEGTYLAQFSPDGKKIAYISGRRSLKVRDDSTGQEITLVSDEDLYHMGDGDKYFTWSPDSKWLLFGWSKTLSNSDVLLISADGSKKINLNESGYYDYFPKWVSGGKRMLWFSNRNGLKSYATSGRSQSDVYAMFFEEEDWDKFNLSKEDYALYKDIEKKKEEKKKKEKKDDKKKDDKKEKKKDDKKKDLKFDWDGLDERTKRLTIHSSSLSDAVLSKDGEKLYYLSRFEGRSNLWTTNLRTRETKMAIKLSANGGSLMWDKEMKNLYLLSGGRISKIDPEGGKSKGIKMGGEIEFDKDGENQYIFDHVWIRTKNIFYHPDFHGIDWDKMKTEYQKYIPHIGNGYELSEMLSELLGELNVSHAGSGYNGNITNGDQTASLGVFFDYNHKGNGIKVTEVIKGGPLDKAHIKVEPGMVIERIDGELIDASMDFARYLNRKANKFTLVEVRDVKADTSATYTVKPISIGQENGLLYRRWVKKNEEEVKKMSNGELGYVHIPGMSDGPYRSIYGDMMGKYFDTKGVIVDTRFNGGGDLVGDLAMFFTGEPFITYETEAKVVGGEPVFRWTKPTLVMFNESNYSDGHCFACGYTDLKIGTTVGMPVPGTCSFAGWEGLPNGGYWGVVPVSAKDKQGNWMENNQTEPTIKIKNMPGKIDKGIDEQLETAINQLLKETK